MDHDQLVQSQLERIEGKVDTIAERVTKLESTEKIYRLLFGSVGVLLGFIGKEVIGAIMGGPL